MYSNAAQPRALFANPNAGTDAEKLQAFGTIVANSGEYQVIGDTLIIRPVISKSPNYMGGGEDRFVMRIVGDTLWLTSIAGAFRWARGQPYMPATSATDSFKLIRAAQRR